MYYSIKWFPFAALIGIISGIVMALFTALIVNLQLLILNVPVYITYPIVGLITTTLLYFGFNEVKGAGISYVLLHKNTERSIPIRSFLTKFFASTITLGINSPAGREGPAVSLGSVLASKVAEKFKMKKEDISNAITIGSAACTAAVFRTPLGGAIFAAEVPYKHDLDETVFLPALVSSAIALALSNLLLTYLVSHPVYLEINLQQFELSTIFAIHSVVLGMIAGLIGIFFSVFFKHFYKLFAQYIKGYFLPFIGMIITAGIVLLIDAFLPDGVSIEGTGFSAINKLVNNYNSINTTALLLLLLGKIIATSTCIGFFNSGGVMGPSLVVGAALGALYDHIFPSTNHIAIIIVGMSALHTATTKTPIASMVLVLEMVGFPNLIIPLILSNTVAFIVSMEFSLYSGQVESKEFLLVRKIKHTDLLETISVSEAMTRKFKYLRPNQTLSEAIEIFYEAKTAILPVLDENNNIVGVVSRVDFQIGFAKKLRYVRDIMTKELITAFPDERLSTIFDRLTDYHIEVLPVVKRKEPKAIIGLIGFKEIEDCYERYAKIMHEKREITMDEIANDL